MLSSKFELLKDYTKKPDKEKDDPAARRRQERETLREIQRQLGAEGFDIPLEDMMDVDDERDGEEEQMEVDEAEDLVVVEPPPVLAVERPVRDSTSYTILENILLQDTLMWKAGRCNLHQLLMRTVFMIYDQKVRFAKTFMLHYNEIYEDFIKDDHEMDVSVVGLSVQFMTVPGLARRLVAEDDALSVISKAIRAQTDQYIKRKKQNVRSNHQSFFSEWRGENPQI